MADRLGWLDVDAMLCQMSRESFNERYAEAVLDSREEAEAWNRVDPGEPSGNGERLEGDEIGRFFESNWGE